jgi:guanylate kinase
MEEEIKKKNLIEHALVHGNYYGSSKKVLFFYFKKIKGNYKLKRKVLHL